MGHPALEFACHWVDLGLSVEMEISRRGLADQYYMGLGGLWWSNVLNSALPPQRLRPDGRPEHQDLVSHKAALNQVYCVQMFSAPQCYLRAASLK